MTELEIVTCAAAISAAVAATVAAWTAYAAGKMAAEAGAAAQEAAGVGKANGTVLRQTATDTDALRSQNADVQVAAATTQGTMERIETQTSRIDDIARHVERLKPAARKRSRAVAKRGNRKPKAAGAAASASDENRTATATAE